MSARPVAKDIIPDKACIGVLGQSLAAAPLGVRVVENLRPVASPDKEQSTEGQHIPECGKFDLKAIDAAIDRISGLGSAANALDAWRIKGGAARNARTA
jgi:hypothetical protein